MRQDQPSFFQRWSRSLRNRWMNLIRPLSLQRLQHTIEVFQSELEAQIEGHQKNGSQFDLSWDRRSKQLLERAKQALADHDAELGWRCLKASDRFRLYGSDADELKNEAKLILTEASDPDKALTSWRRKSVVELLGDPAGELKDHLKPSDVVRAKRTIDEHQDNVYHKLAILKTRLRILTLLSLIAVGLWIAWPPLSPNIRSTAAAGEVSEVVRNSLSTRRLWFAIVLSGILGALFSGFSFSIAGNQGKTRIPAELSTSTITFARLSLAMVSAIVVSIFLLSGILNLPKPSLELMLAVAFVSGFSDRLVLRAIESLSQ